MEALGAMGCEDRGGDGVRNHKRNLAKQLKQIADETARLTEAQRKGNRQQRQADRRKRYAQPTEGQDASADHGAGRTTSRSGSRRQGSEDQGRVQRDDWQEDGQGQDQESQEEEGQVSKEDPWEHTMSPACWCAPIVMHVPPRGLPPVIVTNARDADRLAELGITDVVISPDVPRQR